MLSCFLRACRGATRWNWLPRWHGCHFRKFQVTRTNLHCWYDDTYRSIQKSQLRFWQHPLSETSIATTTRNSFPQIKSSPSTVGLVEISMISVGNLTLELLKSQPDIVVVSTCFFHSPIYPFTILFGEFQGGENHESRALKP